MNKLEDKIVAVVEANEELTRYHSASVSPPSVLKPDAIALLEKKITEAVEYRRENLQGAFPSFEEGLFTKLIHIEETVEHLRQKLLKDKLETDPLKDLIQSLSSDLDGLCDLSGYGRISQPIKGMVKQELTNVGFLPSSSVE